MGKRISQKDLMVKILVAQYNQERAFAAISKRGAFLQSLIVENLEIVFEVVGFPKDNSHEYDFRFEVVGIRDEDKKLFDDNCFCHEWLKQYYHELTGAFIEQKNIVVTKDGIDVAETDNLHLVRVKMAEYIDWLYDQCDKYKRGERPWEQFFKEDREESGDTE